MATDIIEIHFDAYSRPKPAKTLTKCLRFLILLGMLLAGVLVFTGVAAALEIGDRAPNFSLPSTTGEKISLRQFLGQKHVLIQFYKTDFNPV